MVGANRDDDLPGPRYTRGWAAIYVIAEANERPVKVGYTTRPKECVSCINASRGDRQIMMHRNFWVADWRIARRLEASCHELLDKANKRLAGGWFDVDVKWAEKVIVHVADREHIPLWSNRDINQMVASGLIEPHKKPHRDMARADMMLETLARVAKLRGITV